MKNQVSNSFSDGNVSTLDKLKKLNSGLLEEKKLYEEKINISLDQIREIDLYLESLFKNEDSQTKSFYPRNMESMNKDMIESSNMKQANLENENRSTYKELNRLLSKIELLEDIIKDESEKDKRSEVEDHNVNYDVNAEINIVDKKDVIEEVKNEEDSFSEIKTTSVNNISESSVLTGKYFLEMQEKDRQRIAMDLHDNTVQNLTHLIHKIELCSKFMDQDLLRSKLELADISKNLRDTIQGMRDIIYELRPMSFDDIGFTDLMLRLKEQLAGKSKYEISFTISNNLIISDSLMLMTLYRIINECCWNSIKHSNGTKLEVNVSYENNVITITIEDDGVGFDFDLYINNMNQERSKHFGLSMIRERVLLLSGKISFEKGTVNGTKILIQIPHTEEEQNL